MLPRIWSFIRNSKNREVVSWLGGGGGTHRSGAAGLSSFILLLTTTRSAAPSMVTTITQSGPGIASGHDTVVNAPVNIGVDEKQVGQRIVDAQKPLADQLEKLVAQVAREQARHDPGTRPRRACDGQERGQATRSASDSPCAGETNP